jgi:uncharacterized protein YjbJ (UPF0337 family)
MDENRMSGTAKTFEGKVEEGFGRIVGDAKTAAQGQVKQARRHSGPVWPSYGWRWGDYRRGAQDSRFRRGHNTRLYPQ